MSSFWHFAKRMAVYRSTLTWAIVFAFLSAMSLGVGLVTLAPMMRVILHEGEGRSLRALAQEHNADSPLIAVPWWLVERLPVEPFPSVALLLAIVAGLTALGATMNFMHQYLSRTVATRTVADIRLDTFATIVRLPLVRVMERGPSQLVARTVRDTAELLKGFVTLTSKAVAQLSKGLAAFTAALIIDFGLTISAIIVLPVLAIVLRKLGKRIRRGSRRALQAQEDLLRTASETLQGLRAVKANTAEDRAIERFAEQNRDVVHQELRVRTATAAAGPIVETLAIFAIGGLALLAAQQILAGSLQFDRFILALASLGVAGASLRPLAGLVNELQAASAPAGRLLEILGDDPEERRSTNPRSLPRHANSLEFKGVTLKYPGAERRALDQVSLKVRHGERIAIVGPNGSGKTTLLSLLPRLLQPDSGTIEIDGIDIATVTIRSLREQIGVVTQETVMFRGTIGENIAFGVGSATREQIEIAARRAHADTFIQQIPGGYDAHLLEQGASLSGGQRQRLAIARAILRDPAILILDEATSQIDAESEEHINAAIQEFCVGRTSLVIAHRLSTVLNADRIVVMDAGRVVDQGTHEKLLERCDLYARLNRTELTPRAS